MDKVLEDLHSLILGCLAINEGSVYNGGGNEQILFLQSSKWEGLTVECIQEGSHVTGTYLFSALA